MLWVSCLYMLSKSVLPLYNFFYAAYIGHVESFAEVVGWRTQDHKVMSLNPNSGLISKVAMKLWNRVPHEPPMTQRQWGAERKLWPYGTCILVTATGTAIIQKAQYERVGPFPMISGVNVNLSRERSLDLIQTINLRLFAFTFTCVQCVADQEGRNHYTCALCTY